MNNTARRNARIFGEALLAWGMGFRVTYRGHTCDDDLDFGGYPGDYAVHPHDRDAFRKQLADDGS